MAIGELETSIDRCVFCVDANAANAGKAGACAVAAQGSVLHRRVGAHAIGGIASIVGAVIAVIAVDSLAEHRVFTYARHANTGQPTEVAHRAVEDWRVGACAIRRVAGVVGAVIVVVAINSGTEVFLAHA
jgi:hypothetical protein